MGEKNVAAEINTSPTPTPAPVRYLVEESATRIVNRLSVLQVNSFCTRL